MAKTDGFLWEGLYIWGEGGHGTRWVKIAAEQFIPLMLLWFITMRCLCTDSNNSEQGTNSSRRLPHHHGLSAAQADDGDNLFLLSRPLGGILIIPLLPGFRSICIRTAVAALQGNLQVYSVRVYFSVLDVNDVRYAVSFSLFNSARLSHWFVFRDWFVFYFSTGAPWRHIWRVSQCNGCTHMKIGALFQCYFGQGRNSTK